MNAKIKVLMIVKEFGIQGISDVILNYIENINHKRFQVDVLAGDQYAKENLKRLKACGGKFWCVRGRDRNILLYMIRAARIIRKEGYEIVHVHGNSAMIIPELLAAQWGGVSIRITHAHNVTCNHPYLNKIAEPLFFSLYTDALACSEEAGKWMFKNHPFEVINNGVDVSKYTFCAKNRKMVRDNLKIKDEILVGHIGCFNEQKNQSRLIDIFYKMAKSSQNIKLLFIGDGEKRAEAESLVQKYNLTDKVIFCGRCQQVGNVLSAMDIFVFPSLFEGFGLALLEAQISGLICIASNCVPRKANVTEKVKYLALSDSDDAWKENICAEYDNIGTIEDREARSNFACKMVMDQCYGIKDITRKLESLYEKMLQR